MSANVELLKLYWQIGNTILSEKKKEGWGAKIIDKISSDLRLELPDYKGLSVRNLKYMRAFADAYPQFYSISQPVSEITDYDNQKTNLVQVQPAQSILIESTGFVQGLLAQLSWYHQFKLS